jgi:hypothetical protein
METVQDDSVSFGKEITSGVYDHQTIRERRVIDKETMQLEMAREMCQSKLNELLNSELSQRGSPIKQRHKKRLSNSRERNSDDYYELMKRCLEAEVHDV